MTTRLISVSDSLRNYDASDVAANPGVLVEIKADVLQDLMTTPYAIERVRPMGDGDIGGEHPRHRLCV